MIKEEKMPAAFFVIRSTVTDPTKRKEFDAWYQREHLPDVVTLGVTKAWRAWSLTDPSVHQVTYQFPDEASLERAMKNKDRERMVADFARDCPGLPPPRATFVLPHEF